MSAMDTLAEREPVAVGVNVTVIVQLPPAGTLEPQLSVRLKSLEFVPVMVMLVMPRAWFAALFVKVTVFGLLLWPTFTLPKLRLVGESRTTVPVPLREAVCGLFGALSVTVRVPDCAPALLGLNATSRLQFACGATVDGQLSVRTNPEVTVTFEMLSVALPVLVSVMVCCGLVVLISSVAKVRLVGAKVT